jgi:predicted transport protein
VLYKIASHEKGWVLPSKYLCGSLRTSQRVRESLKNKGWLDYKVIRKKDEKGNFYTAGIKYDITPLEQEIYIRRGIIPGESRTIKDIKDFDLNSVSSYEKKACMLNSKIRVLLDSLRSGTVEQLRIIYPDFIRIRYYIPSRYELEKWDSKLDIKTLDKYIEYLKFIFDKMLRDDEIYPYEIKKILKNKNALSFFTGEAVVKEEKKEDEDFVFKTKEDEDAFVDEFLQMVNDEEDIDSDKNIDYTNKKEEIENMKNTTDYKQFGIKDDTWRQIIRCFPEDKRRQISEKTIKDILKIFEEKKVDVDDDVSIINAIWYPIQDGTLIPEYDDIPEAPKFNMYNFLIDALKKGITYASWETNKEVEKYFIPYKEYSDFVDFVIKNKNSKKISLEDKKYFADFLKKLKNVYKYCDRSFCSALFFDFEKKYLTSEQMINSAEEFRKLMKEEREACWQKIVEKGNFFSDYQNRIEAIDRLIYMSFGYTKTLGERLYGAKIYFFDLTEQMKEKIYGKEKFNEIKETKEYKDERHYELYCKNLTKENHFVEYARRYNKFLEDICDPIKDDDRILWKEIPYREAEKRCGKKIFEHYSDFIYDVYKK